MRKTLISIRLSGVDKQVEVAMRYKAFLCLSYFYLAKPALPERIIHMEKMNLMTQNIENIKSI